VEFFKKLFGGGSAPAGDPDGLYFYVQPDRCAEIVRVRVHRYNDLTELDEGGYFVHKSIRASTCFTPVELDLFFDSQRKLTRHTIVGGALVKAAAWQAQQPKA